MSRLRIPFVAFLGGAAVLGCQPSLDGMRFRCGSDLDCPPGWVCDPAARQCVHPEAFGDPGGEIRTDPGLDPGVELGLDTGLDRPEGPPDPSGTDPSSDEPGRELPEDTAPDRGEDSQTDTADVPDVPDAGDVPPPPCDPDPTCDDGNPCTDDLRCPAPLGCIHKYNQAPCAEARCEAGQFFPESVCAAATCSAQVPVSCDDGDACTSDSCDPSAGCRHSAGALDCDDHDACTEDGCDPVKGCTHVPGALDCDDSNDCTADTCDPAAGCVHANQAGPCTGDGACPGSCDGGVCVYPVETCNGLDDDCDGATDEDTTDLCDDTNPCTDDACVGLTGCSHVPNQAICAEARCEGGKFFPAMKCAGGACPTSAGVACDDGNPCTDDSCDPVAGCLHPPHPGEPLTCASAKCDGTTWHASATCSGSQCPASPGVSCDDGDPDTLDSCDTALGCRHEAAAGILTLIYAATQTTNGKLGGRPGADAFCALNSPSGLACKNVHALLCVGGDDEVRDMPANYGYPSNRPLSWYDGATRAVRKFAETWADFLDGTIDVTAMDGLGITDVYWTGCNQDGSALSWNCAGWTAGQDWPTGGCNGGASAGGDPAKASCGEYFRQTAQNCGNACMADGPICALNCLGDNKRCGGLHPLLCVCEGVPPESLNGLDDDLDGAVDEDFDLDHDGVCTGPDCATQAVDLCPTVWTPGNEGVADKCPSWQGQDQEFPDSRPLGLSEPGTPDGASLKRRTNEPVDVPLANGILDDSVVGYWKLDGGQAKDWSGNGNDGVVTGAVVAYGAFTDTLGALQFNGSSDQVSVPDSPSLDLTATAFTVMFWVLDDKQDSQTRYKGVSKGGVDLGVGYELVYSNWLPGAGNSATLNFAVNQEYLVYYYDFLPFLGRWTHVAGVFRNGVYSLYVNSRMVRQVEGKELAPASSAAYPLRIGTRTPGNNSIGWLAGRMDEIVLLDRAMSPDEIEAYYQSYRPYGSTLVPGAQPDLDDVRVTETTPWQAEHRIPSEVVGVRPHSDSSCPMTQDDGTWKDRDDLCGVVGYWRLDGDGKDVTGHGHDATISAAASFSRGRFGDSLGAVRFAPGSSAPATFADEFHLDRFTLEAWIRFPAPGGTEVITKGSWISKSVNYLLTAPSDGRPACSFNRVDGTVAACKTPDSISFQTWTHLACTYDRSAIIVYVNGLPAISCPETAEPAKTAKALSIGWASAGGVEHLSDEVLIHSLAKSPEYLYRRAHPGVPTVRFLSHTKPWPEEDGRYDFLSYSLAWGSPTAVGSQAVLYGLDKTTPYSGLLSPAIGYGGWWRFDEGAGTVAVDSSTRKNNGILSGPTGLPAWAAGLEGTALVFDGLDDSVPVPGVPVIADGSPLTLEAAVRPDKACTYPNDMARIAERETDDGGYSLAMACPDSQARWDLLDGKTWHWIDATPLATGTFSRVAATSDGKVATVSVDGDIASAAALQAPDTTTAAGFRIGASSIEAKFPFAGLIDSVRLMTRALTPDEILHYPPAAATPGPCLLGGLADKDCDGTVDILDCAPQDPDVRPGGAPACGQDGDCDGSLLDPGEECDDGTPSGWDGCTACRIGEFQVNEYTTGDQGWPAVAAFPDGRFVIVWASDQQDGSGFGVFGRRYRPDATEDGPEFQVNSFTTGAQAFDAPSIALLPDGRFVVAWSSQNQDGSSWGVYGQRFEAGGAREGTEFRVNTYTTGRQSSPEVAAFPDGRFWMAWLSEGQGSGKYGVFLQRYRADGTADGGETQVNTTASTATDIYWHRPAVASLADGTSIVAWHSKGPDGSDFGVRGRRFLTDHTFAGDEFSINGTTVGEQSWTSVAALSDGSFVAGWRGVGVGGPAHTLLGRRFLPGSGTPGPEIAWGGGIRVPKQPIHTPMAAAGPDRVLVAWQTDGVDGSSYGVQAGRFRLDGTSDGPAFAVNTYTAGAQFRPALAAFPDGRFVVAWHSVGQDGSGSGVFAQVFRADGTRQPSGPCLAGGKPDSDCDGTTDAEDCAPANACVHPGADEVCDGQDQDCDGQADDDTVGQPCLYGLLTDLDPATTLWMTIDVPSSLDLAKLATAFPGSKPASGGGYRFWTVSLADYECKSCKGNLGFDPGTKVTVAMNATGKILLGVQGSKAGNVLAALTSTPFWCLDCSMTPVLTKASFLDLRYSVAFFVGRDAYGKARAAGAVTGGPLDEPAFGRQARVSVLNRLGRDVFVLLAPLWVGNDENSWRSACDLWCPTPDYSASGSAVREFDLSYDNPAASALFADIQIDNQNSAKISYDDAVVCSGQNWSFDPIDRRIDAFPAHVRLELAKKWSAAWPLVHFAFLADGLTVSNVHEWNGSVKDPANSKDGNPRPWVMRLRPGWTTNDELDGDGDGVPLPSDLCPTAYDPTQDDKDKDGAGDKCAPVTCRSLLAADPKKPSGVYDLDPDGPAGSRPPFKAYCDMTSSGGGWTLLMKIDGMKDTFGFYSPYWTDAETWRPEAPGPDEGETKLAGYATIPFSALRLGMTTSTTTHWLEVPVSSTSLLDLIRGGRTDTTLGKTAWSGLLDGAVLQPNCNLEGMNVFDPCEDASLDAVRIGFLANEQADCCSPDSGIGFGTTFAGASTGSACRTNGADCGGSKKTFPAFGYIYVR